MKINFTKLIFLVVLFFVLSCSTTKLPNFKTKSYTNSDEWKLLEIKEAEIYNVLDTLLFYANQCAFTINGNPFHIDLIFKGDTLNAYIEQYRYTLDLIPIFLSPMLGYFYYSDVLCLVGGNGADHFFKRTGNAIDTLEKVIYLNVSKSEIYYDKEKYYNPTSADIKFYYEKQKFILISKKLCEEAFTRNSKEGKIYKKKFNKEYREYLKEMKKNGH